MEECWHVVYPQLPGNHQVCLTHYKRARLTPSFSVLLFLFCPPAPASPLSPSSPSSLTTGSWLPSTPLFSLSVCLCLYSLNSPLNSLSKLYCIIYHCVAGSSGGRDALAWACRGSSFLQSRLHIHQTYSFSPYIFTKHNIFNPPSQY